MTIDQRIGAGASNASIVYASNMTCATNASFFDLPVVCAISKRVDEDEAVLVALAEAGSQNIRESGGTDYDVLRGELGLG